MNTGDEQNIRRYILRELDEQARQQIEERLMTDADFFEYITLIEDEMAEAYVWGEMEPQERARFEQTFLQTPEGRRQLNFNTDLKQYVAAHKAPVAQSTRQEKAKDKRKKAKTGNGAVFPFSLFPLPATLTAFALATVILLAGIAWLALKVGRLQSQVETLQAQQNASQAQARELEQQLGDARTTAGQLRAEAEAAAQENASLQQQIAAARGTEKKNDSLIGAVLALVLSPTGVRGTENIPEAKLSHDKPILQLTLRVAEDVFKQFHAGIKPQNGDGRPIRPASLKVFKLSSETHVVLQIPAAQLSVGQYIVTLTGTTADGKTETVDQYAFRVSKK